MAGDSKTTLALLNGLCRRIYYGDSEMTDEFLKQELLPKMSDKEFESLVSKCQGYMKSMASTDMDLNQAESFLTVQTKKANNDFTMEQAKVFLKFWKAQKGKIHQSIVDKCIWDNKLKNVSWRIDIASRARHIDSVNVSTAVVEMQIEESDTKTQETLQFEMDEQSLTKMLQSLKEVEHQIESNSS